MQATPTLDFADARKHMVDGQIRPNRINDPRILAAMLALPRERFLPPPQQSLAYADNDVPLGGGRVMPAPLTVARLVQLCAPVSGERALVVGAGAGYGAALLTACGVRVVALEEDPNLIAMARRTLTDAVTLAEGKLAAGSPAQAPYDIILIEGAIAAIPQVLSDQLRPAGGRLVAVRSGRGLASQALLAEMTPSGLRARAMFDCALPELPGLGTTRGFVF